VVLALRILPVKRGYSELESEQGNPVLKKSERWYGYVQSNDVGSSTEAVEQPRRTQ